MAIGVRVTNQKGVNQVNSTTGTQLEGDILNKGFGPFPVYAVTAITAAATLSAANAGVNTISGGGALTLVMPLVATVPGATFVFRCASAHAHVLTGSGETNGTRVFHDSNGRGSRLTLSGTVGAAVTLMCDGSSFQVLGATSGSASAYVIAGT